MKSINPANNELLRTFAPHTKEETVSAIKTAHGAFSEWREASFQIRRIAIGKFANFLREDSERLAKLITMEMGKRISESRYEIEYCAKISEFYANGAQEFLSHTRVEVEDADA